MKKEIGTRIRKLRESKDLTQDNMAVELDITAGAYAKIERGETDPSITRLMQIAEILKVEVAYFLKETPSSILVEEQQVKYGEYASRHDVENLAQLIRLIEKKLENLETRIQLEKKSHEKKK